MVDQKLNVAFAFDEAYAAHGATAIQSLIQNSRATDNLCIYILDAGLEEESKAKLSKLVGGRADLFFLKVPSSFFDDLPTTNHAASAYARLALGQLLPSLKKIVYLDSDLIILDSLSTLFSVDVTEFVVAAVPDAMSFFRGDATSYWRSLNLPDHAVYFSSGVLVMNLDNFRNERVLEQFRDWTKKNRDKMLHSDQSALNALLWNRVKIVDLRWNLQVPLVAPVIYGWGCTEEMLNAVKNPAIVHYSTSYKPWVKKHKVHFSEKYWHYREQANWKSAKPSFDLQDLLCRTREELTHYRNLLRMTIRKLLGRIPKPRKQKQE